MDLQEAKDLAKDVLESSEIIVVLSNKSIFNLDTELEIEAVKEYANSNNLEIFIVKNDTTKEVVEKPKKIK